MLDYEFKYTRYNQDYVYTDENLGYLLNTMINHFYSGFSCCQRVIDHNNKIIYVLLEEEAQKFEPNLNYEIEVLDF